MHPIVTTIVALALYNLESNHFASQDYPWLVVSFLKNTVLIQAVLMKWAFYHVIGLIYGVEPLTSGDEYWLYDMPANSNNVPSFIIFPKPEGDSQQFLNTVVGRIGRGHRCSIKLTKILGKHFFERLTDEEYETWKRTNTAVMPDITSE